MDTNRSRASGIVIAGALIVVSIHIGGAQTRPRPEGHPTPGWDRPRTLACAYLGEFGAPGLPNRIIVKENPATSKRPPFEVDFMADWPTSPKIVLVYPEGYSFLGMDVLSPDMVATVWSAASEGVVQVFHLVKGGARLALENSGWATVEYWHNAVLISQSGKRHGGEYRHTTCQIWEWRGGRYKLVTTVPYPDRLEALSRLEQDSERAK